MKTPKTTSAKSTVAKTTAKLTDAVALPASTGSGVTSDVNVKDALWLGEHQNDDIAGDLAASTVTRPVVAVGSIVEPVNPALASEPAVTGDAAGDAAIQAAGAGPEFVQPAAVVMTTLRPDAYVAGSAGAKTDAAAGAAVSGIMGKPMAYADHVNALINNPYIDPAISMSMAENAVLAQAIEDALAETGCSDFADLVDMAIVGMSLMATIDIVTKQDGVLKGWTPAEDPAEIVTDLLNIIEDRKVHAGDTVDAHSTLDSALASGARYIRITSKIEGFRRAGRAHSRQQAEYRLDVFSPKQIEQLLSEPNLVTEIV